MSFVHLHVHTQYSILDGLSDIGKLFARARELGMPALAITDHGNMYGVKEFFKFAYDKSNLGEDKQPLVKPIIGCEVYVTRHYDHHLKDNEHRKYYHLTLLAKNYEGYKNLLTFSEDIPSCLRQSRRYSAFGAYIMSRLLMKLSLSAAL